MRIGIGGHFPIEIPDDLAKVAPGKFDGSTPYISKLVERLGRPSYITDKLPRKLQCIELNKVRALALGGYETVTEPLAGVGLTARILANGGNLHLNDFDEGCRKVLALNFETTPTGYNAFQSSLPAADLVFMDFNDFTLKRFLDGTYEGALVRVFKAARQFVLVNDCSPFYFRYGKQSYDVYSAMLGKPVTSVPDYLQALRSFYKIHFPDWWLVHAAYFRDSSFQLFSKHKVPLEVEEAPPAVYVTCNGQDGTFF